MDAFADAEDRALEKEHARVARLNELIKGGMDEAEAEDVVAKELGEEVGDDDADDAEEAMWTTGDFGDDEEEDGMEDEEEEEGDGALFTTNMRYDDFFAPMGSQRRKSSRKKGSKPPVVESEDEEDEDDDEDAHARGGSAAPASLSAPVEASVSEDAFFSLAEMDAFADAEEDALAGEQALAAHVKELVEGGMDEEEAEAQAMSAAGLDDGMDDDEEELWLTADGRATDVRGPDFFDGLIEEMPEPSSSHGRRKKRLHEEIEQLEEDIVAEKTWSMTGEVVGRSRPENSLLSTELEYDRMTRVAPVITEDFTESLEDMIKRRILEGSWDDPERKAEVREDFRPQMEVSQEKSELGLADEYAAEYETRFLGAKKEDKMEKERQALQAMYDKLCGKLDSLSHFHHRPRPAVHKADLSADVPAIAMEEVTPLAVSEASRKAPEEAYAPKKGREGVLRGETELTKKERKRDRQARKSARRKREAQSKRERKVIAKLRPGMGNKYAEQEALETIRDSRSTTVGDATDRTKYSSSSAFFDRLTEQVRREVHGDAAAGKGKKAKKKRLGGRSAALKL
eukprot:PLAT8223.1.p1 GENE.PLAT8223.1~~PLAT8223.1.p1  ORF type:complete len:613 (-),score=366.05 PLAT8223.1:36-1745(-)